MLPLHYLDNKRVLFNKQDISLYLLPAYMVVIHRTCKKKKIKKEKKKDNKKIP